MPPAARLNYTRYAFHERSLRSRNKRKDCVCFDETFHAIMTMPGYIPQAFRSRAAVVRALASSANELALLSAIFSESLSRPSSVCRARCWSYKLFPTSDNTELLAWSVPKSTVACARDSAFRAAVAMTRRPAVMLPTTCLNPFGFSFDDFACARMSNVMTSSIAKVYGEAPVRTLALHSPRYDTTNLQLGL